MNCPVCLKEVDWWNETFKVYRCGHATSEFMSEVYQKIETEETKKREWKDVTWLLGMLGR